MGEAAGVSPAARLLNKGGSGYLVGRMYLLKNNMKTKNMGFDGLVLPELQLLSLQKRLMIGEHVRRLEDKLCGPHGNGSRKWAT